MCPLKLGYREFFQTQMCADIPLPSTPDNWYSTRLDSTHSFMWQVDHKPTFKAIIGRAIHNLMTIYIGEQLTHPAAKAAVTAARTKAATAYAGFSGNAFDLDPWIMTGLLLNKLGIISTGSRISGRCCRRQLTSQLTQPREMRWGKS